MGWQDREYNAGREEMKAYFANPLGLLQYALPIYKSATLQIRLTFWFLLSAIFIVVIDLRAGIPAFIPLDIAALLAVCLFHELGHRTFSRWVGGNHWEWVIWPAGGVVAPTAPRTAKATFVANVGGIAFNALLMAAIVGVTFAMRGWILSGPGFLLPWGWTVVIPSVPVMVMHLLSFVVSLSFAMIIINLYPCYWFDGGHLWQSILWPFLGQLRAGIVTCWAGMILAVPFFLLALYNVDILGMMMWALIFADCFRRRQMLAAAAQSGIEEEESSYNYMDTQPEPKKKKRKKSWLGRARKRALADQAEQAKIDAILVKVKEKGLHSLSWWEKRTLRKATERQRQTDVANRL